MQAVGMAHVVHPNCRWSYNHASLNILFTLQRIDGVLYWKDQGFLYNGDTSKYLVLKSPLKPHPEFPNYLSFFEDAHLAN